MPQLFYDPSKTFDENVDEGPFFDDIPALERTGEPQYSFLGHPLYLPFGIAAGPLPTSKHVKAASDWGYDVVCYKTQRSVSFPSNDFPNVTYLDVDGDLTLEKAAKPVTGRLSPNKPNDQLTITNSFGNPSRGPEFWAEDMKQALAAQGKGQLLIASAVGTIQEGFGPEEYYGDFAKTAKLAADAGVKVIELNLSCPNVASEGVICYTPGAVVGIARKTKELVGDVPLIAKIGYFAPEQQALLEQIITDSAPYFAAYSAINTISAPVVDENGEQLLPGEGRLKSGACGAGIKWAGLDMVKRLDAIRKNKNLEYDIIGIGGVMHPADYEEYRSAGADVVQAATGPMWNPGLAREIAAKQ